MVYIADVLQKVQSLPKLQLAAIVLFYLPVSFLVFRAIYNIYFHPLASYPGPLIARATSLWRDTSLARGRLFYNVHLLHQKYGPIVRVAPDELSYIDSQVWKDVWGHRHGKPEVPKSRDFYDSNIGGSLSIIGSENPRHAELRRMLAHGFSEKALKEQEETVQQYANLMIKRLHENCKGGERPVNLVSWFNYFSFDTIGDLVFGESFGSLENSRSNPWIDAIIGDLKSFTLMAVANQYPGGKFLAPFIISEETKRHSAENFRLTQERSRKRMASTEERTDLVVRMAKPGAVTEFEFIVNALSLIGPGSETAATLLSGAVYYLLQNPPVLKKLVDEVRSAFTSPEEITFVRCNNLKYLHAVLDEALRMYPPVPSNLPRRTATDEVVCGKHVPPGTRISVYQYAMFRSPRNFTRPENFCPERHLGDPEFENDDKLALQPFTFGPRSCLGKNLANFEMRLVLSKLLFNFDLIATPELQGWPDQSVWFVWHKHPLMVKLRPVRPAPV